jgi:hypothetical protein
MYALDQRCQIVNQLGKGFAERFPSSDQHIVMVSDKVTRACCHSGAKATFYAIAFGGIAGFLGDGEADAGFDRLGGNHLQPKRRTPGAIAPGGPLKLAPPGQPAQGVRLLPDGRHAATRP